MKPYVMFFSVILMSSPLFAQAPDSAFTRADSLRGMLSPERTCYDVRFYHLDVRVDPADSSVRGSNDIVFDVVRPFKRMQVDLFANMKIDGITLEGNHPKLSFIREGGRGVRGLPVGTLRGIPPYPPRPLQRQSDRGETSTVGRRVHLGQGQVRPPVGDGHMPGHRREPLVADEGSSGR